MVNIAELGDMRGNFKRIAAQLLDGLSESLGIRSGNHAVCTRNGFQTESTQLISLVGILLSVEPGLSTVAR